MAHVNFKLLLAYDGTEFHGWQAQLKARTVQQELEIALGKTQGGPPVTVWGAGRTDAGVHARGQVAHVFMDSSLGAEQLLGAVNSYLPDDVRVLGVETVADDFHARYSATARHYSYALTRGVAVLGRQYIWQVSQPIEGDLFHRCAAAVVGRHDFAGFVKANSEVDSTVCIVAESRWEHSGDQWTYHLTANRFLHHMVRYLVGTMLEIAKGRHSVDAFIARLGGVLDGMMVKRAPARGLVLEEISYDAE